MASPATSKRFSSSSSRWCTCTGQVFAIMVFFVCSIWITFFLVSVQNCGDDIGDDDNNSNDNHVSNSWLSRKMNNNDANSYLKLPWMRGLDRIKTTRSLSSETNKKYNRKTDENAGGEVTADMLDNELSSSLIDQAEQVLLLIAEHDIQHDSGNGGSTTNIRGITTTNNGNGNKNTKKDELMNAALLLAQNILQAQSSLSSIPQSPSNNGDKHNLPNDNLKNNDNEEGKSSSSPLSTTLKNTNKPAPSLRTQQTCYVQSDESEICVYDGPLCYDGITPVVILDRPVKDPVRLNDFTASCMDTRYYEPSSPEDFCQFMQAGERSSFDINKPRNPSQDTPLSLRRRRWGPINRNGLMMFRELSVEEVWGTQPENVWKSIDSIDQKYKASPNIVKYNGSNEIDDDSTLFPTEFLSQYLNQGSSIEDIQDTVILREGPFDVPGLPGLTVRRRTHSHNLTIDWIDDDVLWLAGLDGQWNANPYHWFSKIGALYDAQRANGSSSHEFGAHPMDSYPSFSPPGYFGNRATTITYKDMEDLRKSLQANDGKGVPSSQQQSKLTINSLEFDNPFNHISWKVGPQWNIPPMDTILFVGDGAKEIKDIDNLGHWFKGTLKLATQPHTKSFFYNGMTKFSPNHLICSTKGVIPGGKNKFFTGRADAWLFRQYAYMEADLVKKGIKPHPLYPPRKITIIDRKGLVGRGIYNRDEVVQASMDTGLPVELVPSLGKLTFEEQVTLMSGTGILIAPHGAALANAMFLPAHSVVIEMFPYLMKKNTYRYLTNLMDLHYYPIYSWDLLDHNETSFYGVRLMNEMYFWKTCVASNMSAYDALLYHACNAASKNYPIVINMVQLKQVIREAIDTIGAYSTRNPAWNKIVQANNIPLPSPPAWIKDTRE